MAEQQLLDITLPRRRAFERDDFFVSASNQAAVAMIENGASWPNGQLLITGPTGSGKTHLAHVWIEATGAERVVADNLREGDVAALTSIGAVVVENVDRMHDVEAETALFHLMNLARAEGAALLVTSCVQPSHLALSIRDLASRLAGLTHVAIDAPDEALMRNIIIKQFHDRHLNVAKPVVAFLARRIERSALATAETVNRLDILSQAEAHAITIPFIKRHMTF